MYYLFFADIHYNSLKNVAKKNVSVMILHRPGCDLLDKIVRDVSFIFHSYDIDVQTPLLEMNSIDAEGGIASYIQRNIKQCSYVVVFVTDPIKGNRKILKVDQDKNKS